MAIQFPVPPGSVLLCDYDTGFRKPEMVKRRLVVVVSPRLPRRNELCTVVPLSTTPPEHSVLYQCRITLSEEVPNFEGLEKWAKADMLATVGFQRLDKPRSTRDQASGRRRYLDVRINGDDLARVRACILHALGMGALTGGGDKITL